MPAPALTTQVCVTARLSASVVFVVVDRGQVQVGVATPASGSAAKLQHGALDPEDVEHAMAVPTTAAARNVDLRAAAIRLPIAVIPHSFAATAFVGMLAILACDRARRYGAKTFPLDGVMTMDVTRPIRARTPRRGAARRRPDRSGCRCRRSRYRRRKATTTRTRSPGRSGS